MHHGRKATREEQVVARTTTPRLPREAEPPLPWIWLRPGRVLWLVLGFVVLCATGAGTAIVFADATPVWGTGMAIEDITEFGVTPQADTLQPGEVRVDVRVAVWLADRRPTWLLALATLGAHAAKIWVVVPVVVIVGGVVWRRTGRGSAFWLPALGVIGGLALSTAVKFIVFRPRPPLEVAAVEAFGPSYPSGHVIRAAAAYGALAWLAAATTRRRGGRVSAWAAAGALVAVVGAARVYEGAHWLTDVLASLLLGSGWLVVVLAASGLLGAGAAPSPGFPPSGPPSGEPAPR